MYRYRLLYAALLLCATADATEQTRVERSQLQAQQTEQLTEQGKQWGLSRDEYQRYQQLMNGPRGTQSSGLDPLTTLGIEARNQAEREKYAQLWVKQEFIRAEKELKFQRAVDAAWQRLNLLPVNLSKSTAPDDKQGHRLALFVKAKDCEQCATRLAAVLADSRPVDIYLVDSGGSDSVLRHWARSRQIPLDRVRSGQITLNHDAGRWLKFGYGLMPVVLQKGDQGWSVAAF